MAENIETRISSEQAKEAIYQAHLSKDAISKIGENGFNNLEASASEINGKVIPIETIALLRAKTVTPSTVWVSGYYTKGDGAFGSNIFEWDSTSTETDNGGTIIKLTSIVTGRYKLKYSGAVSVKWFGAKENDNTVGVAVSNSVSITKALNLSSHSYIPNGIFYTTQQIHIETPGVTIDFAGTIRQLEDISSSYHAFLISTNNVTLNNPIISQEGRSGGTGTHSCLAIYGDYNTGSILINGGVIKYGASNCFQGGRNNVKFIGTSFLYSGEHLIYGNGTSGNGTKDGNANGLHFVNCTFSNPGTGNENNDEANHIQIRNYKNVTMNNCICNGIPLVPISQSAVLITNVENFTASNCDFEDYNSNMVYQAGSTNIKFVNCNFKSSYIANICTTTTSLVKFVNCTFTRGGSVKGRVDFNNCEFINSTELIILGVLGVGYLVKFSTCVFNYSSLSSMASRLMSIENIAGVLATAEVEINNCEVVGNPLNTSGLGFCISSKFNVVGLKSSGFTGSNFLWFKHSGCVICTNVVAIDTSHTFLNITSAVSSSFILSNIVSGTNATYRIDATDIVSHGVVSRTNTGSGLTPSQSFTFTSADAVPKSITVKNNILQKYV